MPRVTLTSVYLDESLKTHQSENWPHCAFLTK